MLIAVSRGHQTTVYERITEALKARGYTGSERAWCASVGLSATYLSQLRARCKANPNTKPDAPAALKISEALGLTMAELLGSAPVGQEYPEREAAIRKARDLGISPEAIEIGSAATPPPGASELWWFARFEAAEVLLRGSRPSAILRSLSK